VSKLISTGATIQKALKVSEDCLSALRITYLDPLSRWNDTLAPRM
jgi:hypothetical protein